MPRPTPLVLLHPFPLDARFWAPVIPMLSASRPVIAPDFPGLGRAEPVAGASVDGFADAVAGLIAAEAPGGRAAVCGLSLGGYVALSLVARHPERVAALILADTRAEPDTPEAAAARHESAAQVRGGGLPAFLDDFTVRLVAPGDGDSLAAARAIADAQTPEGVAGALEALAGRGDRRPDLAGVTAPTMVIVGSEDVLTPPERSEALVAGIAGSELVVVPGAGHLTALERPDAFARTVVRFLARRLG